MEGCTLNDRFVITKFIEKGSNGKVYSVMDNNNPEAHLVVKFDSNYKSFAQEIKIMRRIGQQQGTAKLTPDALDYGMAIKGEKLYGWVIMPRYGRNIEQLFDKMDYKFSKNTIYKIGVAFLNSLQVTHKAGYVYNDLKPDNLMVGYKQHISYSHVDMLRGCSLHLVDFGFASKYLDPKSRHIKEKLKTASKGTSFSPPLTQWNFKKHVGGTI